ncbi:hypothetical protein WN55_08315 [Dufourea novaeangliae]|uniref:Uncharacterized protein n=1 Tax=Dufourea novaeangliae TaxID=178035 RepID=A0A154P878_DUFNO|nr:hypothetical protein WN55_08315 [Dufourea novaeangliae]
MLRRDTISNALWWPEIGEGIGTAMFSNALLDANALKRWWTISQTAMGDPSGDSREPVPPVFPFVSRNRDKLHGRFAQSES